MHSIHVNTESSKADIYKSLIGQIQGLIEPELPPITNISNIIAALKQTFNWWWVGFYFVHQNELILGPFQGPVACTRIQKGKGVCGASWQQAQTIIVEDVNQFPGHIACSAASLSEIVVPVIIDNQVIAVLDIDSELLACFDQTDKEYLESLMTIIKPIIASYRVN